jgi:hypothetical protein
MDGTKWMLALALGAGCGPGTSDDTGSDGDGSGDDGPSSSADDGSATSSGSGSSSADGSGTGTGGIECPPNSVYAVPGCGDAKDPSLVPLPEPGCYEVCEDGDSSVCSEGACVRTWIDPCYGSVCGACGGEQWLCIAGEPLTPGFEADLAVTDGCGSTGFSVHAANADGDILLTVSVRGTVVETAQMTGMTEQQGFELPADEVTVRAWTGPLVASNACNDAPFGTILRTYEGVAGTVDVTFEPNPMGGFEDPGTATVVLTDVDLQQVGGQSVSIWCCPG